MNLAVDMYRSPGQPWGFRLQGGADYRSQLGVKKVTAGSPAARNLRAGDEIITIQNQATSNMTHKDAENIIRNSGDTLSLTIKRGDDPLANYRPDGPIKFNVQRAQQVQAQMGIMSGGMPVSPQSPGHYHGPPSYPPVSIQQSQHNGYVNGYPVNHSSQQMNGPGSPGTQHNIAYNSYY